MWVACLPAALQELQELKVLQGAWAFLCANVAKFGDSTKGTGLFFRPTALTLRISYTVIIYIRCVVDLLQCSSSFACCPLQRLLMGACAQTLQAPMLMMLKMGRRTSDCLRMMACKCLSSQRNRQTRINETFHHLAHQLGHRHLVLRPLVFARPDY